MQMYKRNHISDHLGKKYGYLAVIGQSLSGSAHSNYFDFRCECGNIISEEPNRVISGHKKTCGKCNIKSQRGKNANFDSLVGQKINNLTAIGISKNNGKTVILCVCDCGNKTELYPWLFRGGKVKSCGCSKKSSPAYKDGRTKHELYGTWRQMIDRCENPKHRHYDRYGARGISVCDEWHDFWSFVKWSDSVGGRPTGFTLDRTDNDGNYCPENCRWANWETQTSNKSSNRVIEYNGKSQTIKQWAEELHLHHQTLLNRIDRGWGLDKALTPNFHNENKKHNS